MERVLDAFVQALTVPEAAREGLEPAFRGEESAFNGSVRWLKVQERRLHRLVPSLDSRDLPAGQRSRTTSKPCRTYPAVRSDFIDRYFSQCERRRYYKSSPKPRLGVGGI